MQGESSLLLAKLYRYSLRMIIRFSPVDTPEVISEKLDEVADTSFWYRFNSKLVCASPVGFVVFAKYILPLALLNRDQARKGDGPNADTDYWVVLGGAPTTETKLFSLNELISIYGRPLLVDTAPEFPGAGGYSISPETR